MRIIIALQFIRYLGRHAPRGLCCLLIVFGIGNSVALAGVPAGTPAASSYRIVRLTSDRYAVAVMNARGQVAFHVERDGRSKAMFYDGHRLRDFGSLGGTSATVAALNNRGQIAFNVLRNGGQRAMFYCGRRVHELGTLGGRYATAAAMNEHGQVAGTSSISADGAIVHPYRWSTATGMTDLGRAGLGDAVVVAINNRGQVAGHATYPGGEWPERHGFFWSRQTGIVDIGVLGDFSIPGAMNDAGTIVGYAGSGPYDILAFRWTREGGISDMGTLPHEFTWAVHINRAGQVVGASPFRPQDQPHPFLWTPGQGLLDLGVGTAARGAGTEVNAHGMVIGYLFKDFILSHGFIWTRETGLIEIGAGSPLLQTAANDVNDRGQVVGSTGGRAFIWTRAQDFIDLNTLTVDAPAGLVLDNATAISESGAILATAQSGLYLLVPREGPRRP